MTPRTALRGIDRLFLELESPSTPMHSGSLAIFDEGPLTDAHGRVRIEAIRAEIERRMDAVPQLRQRVPITGLGRLRPVWTDDPDFDVSRHVRTLALPRPGGDDDLARVCGNLLSMPIDLGHPLWEVWFLEGLAGGRVGMVAKLHHALADGIADVKLANVMFDANRNPSKVPAETRVRRHTDTPSSRPARVAGDTSLRADLVGLLAGPAEAVAEAGKDGLRAGSAVLRHPLGTTRTLGRLGDSLTTLLTPRTLAPRCSLNRPIDRDRRVALVRHPISELKRVEHRYGVTLNDVLLTAVAGGLAHLFRVSGHTAPSEVQVLVPVAIRHPGDRRLDNSVSAMIARLPVTPCEPLDRLRAVSRGMSTLKRRQQALAVETLFGLLDPLPRAALVGVAQVVHRQPFVNLVVTNVPGPPFELFALGAAMLDLFPFLPLGGNLSIGVAALSYEETFEVGFLSDGGVGDDLEVLARAVDQAFSELVLSAGA